MDKWMSFSKSCCYASTLPHLTIGHLDMWTFGHLVLWTPIHTTTCVVGQQAYASCVLLILIDSSPTLIFHCTMPSLLLADQGGSCQSSLWAEVTILKQQNIIGVTEACQLSIIVVLYMDGVNKRHLDIWPWLMTAHSSVHMTICACCYISVFIYVVGYVAFS